MQRLLALDGHEVAVAHSGPEGLSLAKELRPDVVFCDIGLPDMDGYEVGKAFRSHPQLRTVFLIALTGYGRPEDIQRTVEAGFNCHLTKPPTWEQLREAIESAQNWRQERRT